MFTTRARLAAVLSDGRHVSGDAVAAIVHFDGGPAILNPNFFTGIDPGH